MAAVVEAEENFSRECDLETKRLADEMKATAKEGESWGIDINFHDILKVKCPNCGETALFKDGNRT